MKVLLTANVPKLGKAGEVKEVAGGNAKNFLFAQGLAIPAAGGAAAQVAAGIASRDYTPGKAAAAKARELFDGGAAEWSSIHELMALIEQTWPQQQTQQ